MSRSGSNDYEVPVSSAQRAQQLLVGVDINSKQLAGFLTGGSDQEDEYSMPDVNSAATPEKLEYMRGLRGTYGDNVLMSAAEAMAQQEERSGYWSKREAKEGSSNLTGPAAPPPLPTAREKSKAAVLGNLINLGDEGRFNRQLKDYARKIVSDNPQMDASGVKALAATTLIDSVGMAINTSTGADWISTDNFTPKVMKVVGEVFTNAIESQGDNITTAKHAHQVKKTLQTGRRRGGAGFGADDQQTGAEGSGPLPVDPPGQYASTQDAYTEVLNSPVDEEALAAAKSATRGTDAQALARANAFNADRAARAAAAESEALYDKTAVAGVDAFGKPMNQGQAAEAAEAIAAEAATARAAARVARLGGMLSRRREAPVEAAPEEEVAPEAEAAPRAPRIPRRLPSAGVDSSMDGMGAVAPVRPTPTPRLARGPHSARALENGSATKSIADMVKEGPKTSAVDRAASAAQQGSGVMQQG